MSSAAKKAWRTRRKRYGKRGINLAKEGFTREEIEKATVEGRVIIPKEVP